MRCGRREDRHVQRQRRQRPARRCCSTGWPRPQPDVACLQELKAPEEKFPAAAIEKAGYGAIWHGQSRWNGVAILARGCEPVETHRGLPGDPDDSQRRYIEAAVNGVLVGCLYLPNGNPVPGPKFDYKLAWMERLHRPRRRAGRRSTARSCSPATITSSRPRRDVYKPERWLDDALFQPEPRAQYRRLLAQGWTDAIRHLHPDETIFTFWDYWRNAFARNAGIRIDHCCSTRSRRSASRRPASTPWRPRPRKGQRPRPGLDRTSQVEKIERAAPIVVLPHEMG